MNDAEVVYLDLDDLHALIERILGDVRDVVADEGLLLSALHRPQASVAGQDAYPGLDDKAAALMHSLVGNHALVDGNKRLGVAAMLLFYGMNDRDVTASDDDLYELTMAVARGDYTAEELAKEVTRWTD